MPLIANGLFDHVKFPLDKPTMHKTSASSFLISLTAKGIADLLTTYLLRTCHG